MTTTSSIVVERHNFVQQLNEGNPTAKLIAKTILEARLRGDRALCPSCERRFKNDIPYSFISVSFPGEQPHVVPQCKSCALSEEVWNVVRKSIAEMTNAEQKNMTAFLSKIPKARQ